MASTPTNNETPGVDSSKASHNEKFSSHTGSTHSAPTTPLPFNPPETKKLLQKLDLNLLPILVLIYLLCFLDRTNIGNARLVNLEKDLNMNGVDYNTAIAIFFPFYIVAEIPSNLMMKRFRPSIWLPFIIVSWGVTMTCTGFVHNYKGLLVCRALLGTAEAGLFPGVAYFITTWYNRHECAFRMAVFYSSVTAAGAFGGLLARGISEMDGVAGKAGWSWIFILEGLLTVVVGAASYWAINDYPANARFLTTPERVEVQRRQKADGGLSDEMHLRYMVHALKDWKIWVNMFISVGIFTPLYSISTFLPTIIRDMGYSDNKAQLMTVPPYALGCIFTVGTGYFADKAKQRGIFLLCLQALSIIGFLFLVTNGFPLVQYTGTFFAAAGIYAQVPLMGAWNSNNIGGSLKRGVGIAMQVGFGNLGGIIAGFVYISHEDAPRFITGHCVLIAVTSMSFFLTSCMTMYYCRENARRDAYCLEHDIDVREYTQQMKWDERERGDYATFFRYTV